jgi:hypothetical protein
MSITKTVNRSIPEHGKHGIQKRAVIVRLNVCDLSLHHLEGHSTHPGGESFVEYAGGELIWSHLSVSKTIIECCA